MKRPAFLLGLFALACAKQETPQADTTAAAAPAAPNVVQVVTTDFAFDVPDTIPAGLTTFRLVNKGPAPHHVQLVRLEAGKTVADFTTALQSMKPGSRPPSWVRMVPGPNPPEVGAESNLTLAMEPGTYAMICFVDVPDKVPHFAKGMVRELTVTEAPAPVAAAAPPTADVTITLRDYTWDITPALTAGRHVIRLENAGPQPHELVLVKVAEGKTPEDVGKWAASFNGPPPFAFIGGASNMEAGAVAWMDVDLTPGTYMLFCFYPDATDGKPHMEHGMVKPVTVS